MTNSVCPRRWREAGLSLIIVGIYGASPAAVWQLGAGSGGGGGSSGGTPAPIVMPAPPPPAGRVGDGTGAISGVLTDGATKQPLGGVVVSLEIEAPGNGAMRPPPLGREATDEKGRFVFRDLPASDAYVVSASKFGYFDGGYGKKATSSAVGHIVLTSDEWFSRANIELWRYGAITGAVLDEQGDPLVGAYVRVLRQIFVAGTPRYAAGPAARTDDRGLYRIAGLGPGRFAVCVPSVQMSVPAGTPRALLARQGTISVGSIGSSPTDAESALDGDGTNRLVVGGYATPGAKDGVPLAYPIAFYPAGASITAASTVELAVGRDAAGIDFRIEPLPAFRVSGLVDGPRDVIGKLTLRLLPAGNEDLGVGLETATALVAPDGAFTFLHVPAGDYVIDVRGTIAEYEADTGIGAPTMLPTPPGMSPASGSSTTISSGPPGTGLRTLGFSSGDGFWGRLPVSVGGRESTGNVLSLHRTLAMSGHLVFDGQSPPPAQPAFVFAEPADGNPALGRPANKLRPGDPAGFLMDGFLPGQYFLRLLGTGDVWTVKSILFDGRDFSRIPFDASLGRDFSDVVVTLTDKVTTVSGRVAGPDGTPPASARVIVFPVEREQWTNYGLSPQRIKSISLTSAGGYRVTGLPAGDYFAIAVDDSLGDAWQEPRFLDLAARFASRLSLAWGDHATRDLTVVSPK